MISSDAKKFFKSEARKTIYGDWLTHIFAHLLVFVCFAGIVSLGQQMGVLAYSLGISENYASMFLVFYDVAALFMALPLVYGVMYFEMLCSEGKKPNASVVFTGFSSMKELLGAYELFFALFIRVLPCFVPAIAVWIYMQYYYSPDILVLPIDIKGFDEAYFALSTAFAALLLLGLVLSSRFFVGVYVCLKRPYLSKRDAFYVGSLCCHNNSSGLVSLFFSFVPLLVISLFTVGILFIAYTVPYIILTFMNAARFLYEIQMNRKDIQNLVYEDRCNGAA